VHTLAVGELAHDRGQLGGDVVHRGVVDGVCGARSGRQRRLLRRGDRRQHAPAGRHGELGGEQADAARARGQQDVVPRPHLEGGPHEVVRGDALQRQGGGSREVQAVRDGDDARGVHRHQLGVRARSGVPRHAVADREAAHVRADRLHGAGTLGADDVGVLHGVHPGAAVDVDEVDARRGDADQDLAGTGCGVGELGVGQDLGTARFSGYDCVHGASL
jgi:hypothetical protein